MKEYLVELIDLNGQMEILSSCIIIFIVPEQQCNPLVHLRVLPTTHNLLS